MPNNQQPPRRRPHQRYTIETDAHGNLLLPNGKLVADYEQYATAQGHILLRTWTIDERGTMRNMCRKCNGQIAVTRGGTTTGIVMTPVECQETPEQAQKKNWARIFKEMKGHTLKQPKHDIQRDGLLCAFCGNGYGLNGAGCKHCMPADKNAGSTNINDRRNR